MSLSRYGAKGHEETRPAQGVRSRAIKDALILTLVALLSFCVSRRINFNTEGTFIYKFFLSERVSCAYFGKFTPARHPITIAILQRGSPAPDMKRILLALSR